MKSRAHGSVTVNVGDIVRPLIVDALDDGVSIRITDYPLMVWLYGTPDELDRWHTELGRVIAAARAKVDAGKVGAS